MPYDTALIDTGSSQIIVPSENFSAIKASYQQTCSGKIIVDINGPNLPYCYCGVLTSPSDFPDLVVELGNDDFG